MARASFLVRKDGRYFFHKKFVSIRSLPGRPTHMRLSLRTSVYQEALGRMLGVMRVVQLYEVDETIKNRADSLISEMKRHNASSGGYYVSQMVERRALEILVYRFIDEARFANHPLTTSPKDFWPTWVSFCAVNGMLEDKAFRHGAEPAVVERQHRHVPDLVPPLPSRQDDTVAMAVPITVPAVQAPQATTESDVNTDTFSPDRSADDTFTRRMERLPFRDVTSQADGVASGPGLATHQDSARPADDPFSAVAGSGIGSFARISEVLAEYLEQHATKVGDGRARGDVEIVIQFVIDLCGDLRMREIKSEHLNRVEKALPNIPHPARIPKGYQKSLYFRHFYAELHGWDGLKRVSKTRINNGWHRCLRQFFAWAQSKGAYSGPDYKFDLVGAKNPGEKEVDAWTDAEILRLFSLPLFTGCHSAKRHWTPGNRFVQNELYWAYLLIFFMGLRPSEIGRTRLVDFAEIDGRWYIDYRNKSKDSEGEERVKAEASARLIPIPRLLIDLGLLDRRNDLLQKGEKMLFPNGSSMSTRSPAA